MNQSMLGSALATGVSHSIGWLPQRLRMRVGERMAQRQIAYDERFSTTVVQNLATVFRGISRERVTRLATENAYRGAAAQIDHLWAWHAGVNAFRQRVTVSGDTDFKPGEPVVIAAVHQFGMEVAAMRLSMLVQGGVIIDPGQATVPGAARRAWTRFGDQEIIPFTDAARESVRLMRAGKALLVFVEDPPGEYQPDQAVDVMGARIPVTPLVPSLVSRFGAQLRWMNLSQQRAGPEAEWSYRLDLRAIPDAAQSLDPGAWRRLVADKLAATWRDDTTGYWWARKRMHAVG